MLCQALIIQSRDTHSMIVRLTMLSSRHQKCISMKCLPPARPLEPLRHLSRCPLEMLQTPQELLQAPLKLLLEQLKPLHNHNKHYLLSGACIVGWHKLRMCIWEVVAGISYTYKREAGLTSLILYLCCKYGKLHLFLSQNVQIHHFCLKAKSYREPSASCINRLECFCRKSPADTNGI